MVSQNSTTTVVISRAHTSLLAYICTVVKLYSITHLLTGDSLSIDAAYSDYGCRRYSYQ